MSCDGPVAHYSCAIEGVGAVSEDARLKFYCMTELAKAGAHASCSIDRAQQKPCSGAAKTLAAPAGYQIAPPHAADGSAATDAAPPKPVSKAAAETTIPKSPPAEPAPPRTVKEMVDQSAAAAGQGSEQVKDTAKEAATQAGSAVEKAGNAVGAAAKKSWKCLTSFFSEC